MAEKHTVWYKSRTVWANVAVLLIGILTALQADLTAGVSLSIIGVLNIILRVVTTTPLKWD